MERQLVVWCPGLLEPHERGREARVFARVLTAVRGIITSCGGVTTRSVRDPHPGTLALLRWGRDAGSPGRRAPRERLRGRDGAWSRSAKRDCRIGVADGLFAASLAARRSLKDPDRAPVLVAPGGTPGFLSPWPVEILHNPELADLLCRLGIRTLGAFAELPASRHVLARFGTDGTACQAVAAGNEDALPGLRLPLPDKRSRNVKPQAVLRRRYRSRGQSGEGRDCRAAIAQRPCAGVKEGAVRLIGPASSHGVNTTPASGTPEGAPLRPSRFRGNVLTQSMTLRTRIDAKRFRGNAWRAIPRGRDRSPLLPLPSCSEKHYPPSFSTPTDTRSV